MGQEFADKLKEVLHEIGYRNDEISLEQTATGSVGGHIVSASFHGETQMDRQDRLWGELRKHLTPSELTKIVALLTITPSEIGEDE